MRVSLEQLKKQKPPKHSVWKYTYIKLPTAWHMRCAMIYLICVYKSDLTCEAQGDLWMDRWSSLPWFARLTFPSVVRNDSFPPPKPSYKRVFAPHELSFPPIHARLWMSWCLIYCFNLAGFLMLLYGNKTRNRSPRNLRKPALEPRAALLRMRSSRSVCGFLKLVSQNALCVLEREVNSHWTANVVGL